MPDAWEVFVGLSPLEDGSRSQAPHDGANADPDGDGLTNWEEYKGPDGLYPSLTNLLISSGIIKPINVQAFGSPDHDYTLPLNCDSDGDQLIDSFEYDSLNGLNVHEYDDANADPDADGLTTYREQCIHPLMARYWTGTNDLPSLTTVPPPVFFASVYYGGFTTATLRTSGYLNLAHFNAEGDSWPDHVGTVEWGHPVVASTGVNYGGTRRWTEAYAYDTDNDMIPDGWEVEHGLNPLSGLVANSSGRLEPSGGLGNPDDDDLLNYGEYWGNDGYRVDAVTGTGDETCPWITRSVNYGTSSEFGANIGQYVASGPAMRAHQAPSTYPEPFVEKMNPTSMPGFFDPLGFVAGHFVPVPGSPSCPDLTDTNAPLSLPDTHFDPYSVSDPDLFFFDGFSGDGRYTPGVDPIWIDTDGNDAYQTNSDTLLLQSLPQIPQGATGLTLTANTPTVVPMPGDDTDDDGLSDGAERSRIVILNSTEVSLGAFSVCSLSPFMHRSALITSTNGIVIPNLDPSENGRRLFNADWTVECWVYLKDQGPLEYLGSFIQGRITVSTLKRIGYDLGLSNSVPYIRFQSIGGSWSTLTASNVLQKNTWTHLAATFSDADHLLRLLRDGTAAETPLLVVQQSSSSFGRSYGGTVTLGPDRGGAASFAHNVWLDEVRIWGVARDPADIAADRMNVITPVSASSAATYGWSVPNVLLAYFTFDDGGNTAQDFTKPAKVSLAGYSYPADSNNISAPVQSYLYGDQGYALMSDAVKGTNTSFVFDSNNVPPLIDLFESGNGAYDSDGDGLTDDQELFLKLNPFKVRSPAHSHDSYYDYNWAHTDGTVPDGSQDDDGDGQSYVAEQIAGTDPHANSSVFSVQSWTHSATGLSSVLTCPAVSGRVYRVYASPAIRNPVWTKLYEAQAMGTTFAFTNTAGVSTSNRYMTISVGRK